MKEKLSTVFDFVFIIGGFIIVFFKLWMMWEAGDTFLVFMSVFTGIGIFPVLIVGFIQMFLAFPLLGIVYLVAIINYFSRINQVY